MAGLKIYTVAINGVDHELQLDEAGAKAYGVWKDPAAAAQKAKAAAEKEAADAEAKAAAEKEAADAEAKAAEVKGAKPANKAVTPANK